MFHSVEPIGRGNAGGERQRQSFLTAASATGSLECFRIKLWSITNLLSLHEEVRQAPLRTVHAVSPRLSALFICSSAPQARGRGAALRPKAGLQWALCKKVASAREFCEDDE